MQDKEATKEVPKQEEKKVEEPEKAEEAKKVQESQKVEEVPQMQAMQEDEGTQLPKQLPQPLKTMTLGYWNIRGLGERIRHLLEYCKLPYNEIKYDQSTREKWFSEVKPELAKKNPAITLPYLLDGDEVISESDAIMVYICLKFSRNDLMGREIMETVNLATAHGVLKQMHPQFIKMCYVEYGRGTFPQALDVYKKYIKKTREYLRKYSIWMGEREFIAGGLTWIDFALADFLQNLRLLDQDLMDDYPKLLQYQERVWALPELKEYFESDRFSERPCNNYMALWK